VQLATLLAQEVSGTPGVNQHATISWTALAGAASYNVYRTLAAGASGSECVFVGNTSPASPSTTWAPPAASVYQGGADHARRRAARRSQQEPAPAYSSARPAFGYGAVTIMILSGTTPTNPAAGEGMRIQIELGDSDAP
jgi:hypothetical protein